MDKTLVNHQIVSMRKIVKTAKTWTLRKLFRQINQINHNIKKWESHPDDDLQKEKRLEELKRKLESKKIDALTLRRLQPDQITKQALVHDVKHFETILKKGNAEERAIARVALHKLIQDVVKKFREENPGCEQWLPVQIELWKEKTTSNKKIIQEKNKKKITNEKEIPITPKQKEKKAKNKMTPIRKSGYTPVFQVTPLEGEKIQEKEVPKKSTPKPDAIEGLDKLLQKAHKAASIKRVNVNDDKVTFITNNSDDDDNDGDDDEFKTPVMSKVKDSFFLKSGNSIDEDDDEPEDLNGDDDDEFKKKEKRFSNYQPTPKRFKSFEKKIDSGSKPSTPVDSFKLQKYDPNQSFRSPGSFTKPKPAPRRYFNMDNGDNESKGKGNTPTTPRDQVHPSWKAKMEAKQKQKVVIPSGSDSKPNKHIKFN